MFAYSLQMSNSICSTNVQMFKNIKKASMFVALLYGSIFLRKIICMFVKINKLYLVFQNKSCALRYYVCYKWLAMYFLFTAPKPQPNLTDFRETYLFTQYNSGTQICQHKIQIVHRHNKLDRRKNRRKKTRAFSVCFLKSISKF